MNFASFSSSLSSTMNSINVTEKLSQVRTAATQASNAVIGESICQICNDKISKTQIALGMTTYEKCTVCIKECCKKCISKSTDPIPKRIKHAQYRETERLDWVCVQCEALVLSTFMADFKKSFVEDLDTCVVHYFKNNEIRTPMYPQPGPIEDTLNRKLYRFAQVAEVIINNIGYKYIAYGFKALKYAYMGTELYTMLISGDFLSVLGPLGVACKDILGKELGAKGIIYLYYLACKQKLALKIIATSVKSSSITVPAVKDVKETATDNSINDEDNKRNYDDPNSLTATTDGVIALKCPIDILDYVGSKLDAALWLYICKLPPPHSTNEWSCWYLDQLVKRQKWTLVACVDDTTKLRNKRKCPAFALVIRNVPNTNKPVVAATRLNENNKTVDQSTSSPSSASSIHGNIPNDSVSASSEPTYYPPTPSPTPFNTSSFSSSDSGHDDKEVLLLIRGSQSSMDWSMNMNEVPVPYSYHSGVCGEVLVQGLAHNGMLEGALAMLDDYGMRQTLLNVVFIQGYRITVVGHSLGAGVASFVVAELKNSFHTQFREYINNPNLEQLMNPRVQAEYVKKNHKHVFHEQPIGNSKSNEGEDYCFEVRIPEILSAVTYATPPCMSENLADAICADKLSLCVVNSFDIVPRFSKLNILTLVGEVKACQSDAEAWYNEDLSALQTYAYNMGKASDLSTPGQSQSNSSMSNSINKPVLTTMDGIVAVADTAEAKADVVNDVNKITAAEGHLTTPASAITATVDTINPAAATNLVPSTSPASSTVLESTECTSAIGGAVVDVATLTASSLETLKAEEPRMVPPGDIVYLFQDRGGRDQAALVNHRLPSLHRIVMIPERNLDDHKLKDHLNKLKCVRRHHNYGGGRSSNDGNGNKSYQFVEQPVPEWQSIYLNTLSITDNDDDSMAAVVPVAITVNESTPPLVTETIKSIDSNTNNRLESSSSSSITSPPSQQLHTWTPCCVCANDTTWVNILKSEGARARNTHNCRQCGSIVCSICSPAGETLLGDGVSKSYVTPDWRVPLPELGLWEPQRICVHCYFDSYRSITATR